jgi:hypothetical protein
VAATPATWYHIQIYHTPDIPQDWLTPRDDAGTRRARSSTRCKPRGAARTMHPRSSWPTTTG